MNDDANRFCRESVFLPNFQIQIAKKSEVKNEDGGGNNILQLHLNKNTVLLTDCAGLLKFFSFSFSPGLRYSCPATLTAPNRFANQ
jgi:hypothetical protein